MKAVVFNGPYDVSVETVPDPSIEQPTDAVVKVVAAGVCGSDLWTYRGQAAVAPGARIGHEFVGEVVAVGDDAGDLKVGDWVIAPFRFSDGSCEFCAEGLTTSCVNGGFWGREEKTAGQGEFVRVPFAAGTLVKVLPDGSAPDPALVPDLLTLSDVLPTGYHAVTKAGVLPGETVVVIGDGAVGQCAVIAASLAGAERIIVLGGRHSDREQLALKSGAELFISQRDSEAIDAVLSATGGKRPSRVVECVGSAGSFATALNLVRPGGVVGYVGLPHGVNIDLATIFGRNIGIMGGVAPARAHLPRLLDKVVAGELHPGGVFTSRLGLDEAAQGYQLMDERRTIKALLSPAEVA